MDKIFPKIRLFCVLFIFFILSVGSAVVIFEYYKHFTDSNFENLSWQFPEKANAVSYQDLPLGMSTLYKDGQTSFFEVNGSAPWEEKHRYPKGTIFKIKSSRYGFFTKYPVNKYPKKKVDEYRIILVGGSGAQGNGATSNEKMFYSIIENKLNKMFNNKYQITVINLASPGKFAETNKMVLHYFGHDLEPDMILMYNGANDIAQATMQFEWMRSVYESHYMGASFEYPSRTLKKISRAFPYVFHVYGLGPWIKRTFYKKYYEKKAERDVCENMGLTYPFDLKKSFEEFTYPSNFKSIKAIKRDFCGIPIVFALQAIHYGEKKLYDSWFREGIYDEFFSTLSKDLKGYYNNDWHFIDVNKLAHKVYREKYDPEEKHNSIAVHLDDLGHEIVGDILVDHLYPIIADHLENKKTYRCGISS